MSNAASLYWHTLRHLRPVQLYGRVAFRLIRPKPDLRPSPPARAVSAGWQPPAPRAQCLHDDGRCEFLGISHRLDVVGWDDPAIGKLWRYNLHYFDDLVSKTAGAREDVHRALIERWIRENPAGQGSGWEPYPTSLRMVNWAKWLLAGNLPVPGMLDSLAVQARWVAKRTEWHLQGNHLWVNGKALAFAGACFEGPEADGWLARGLDILQPQLAEQVLADGAHFERTPMYHALFVEDLLDLVNLASAYPQQIPAEDVARWRDVAARMLAWLQAFSHGDLLAHFNDVAQGVAPVPSALLAYAHRLGLEPAAMPAPEHMLQGSGLVRLAAGDAVLLADVAAVGPDYIPGHAHADTLAFELALRGQRVFVNGGTSTYEVGAERLRQRGTAAHNTIVINSQDSSEVWSSFRVARRARVFDVEIADEGSVKRLAASHDGYRLLPGRPVHRRTWTLTPTGLAVVDELDGRFDSAEAMFHLDPAWTATVDGPSALLRGPAGDIRVSVRGGRLQVEEDVHPAGFGNLQPAQALRVSLDGPRLETLVEWT